ncbi:MAG: histone deacetylase [Acidobacteria bacterium]|nr:histone deacetylase [Acidobacteriota bacterium]
MPIAIVTSDRCALHQPPPGHPERPERHDVMSVVAEQWRNRGAQVIEPDGATREQLERVHLPAYLDQLEATAGQAVMLDPDTFTSPESWEVATVAAGAALKAVDTVLDGTVTRAAALVRPPGHHAEPSRAMGFCLLNNVAIAAAEALARGVDRVAIVDFDVHHGNGTQRAFLADPRVLFVSIHQWPYYPGSGHESEVGAGDGTGYTVNVPMDAGATDEDYDSVMRRVVVPIVTRFNPGLMLVSAGYDAHELDPLGGMRMTDAGYARLMRHLVAIADQSSLGRLVMVTEGGYHLPALAASLDASLRVLSGDADRPADGTARADAARSVRGDAAVERVRTAQCRYWRGL